jgi:isocitrate dehydrogenase
LAFSPPSSCQIGGIEHLNGCGLVPEDGHLFRDVLVGRNGRLVMALAANIGVDAAIFEAVHGSTPLGGKGVANPLALLLAAAMMLDRNPRNRNDLAQGDPSPAERR